MNPKPNDIPTKAAGGCVRITVTVPVDVKKRMDALKGKRVNWSKVAADAFKGVCDVLKV